MRCPRSIFPAFHLKVFPMEQTGKVHFQTNCTPVISRLKLNSSKGVFKNFFYDFEATFAEISIKPPSECLYFYKNTSLFNKQLGYN